MITAEPRGLFSRDYDVYIDEGGPISLEFTRFGEEAEFQIDGVTFRIHREGMFSGHFTLVALHRVLADAYKRSVFHRSFEIELEGDSHTLTTASHFGRSFSLLQGGRRVGWIGPVGIFSRSMECVVPDHLPLPLQVFLLSLVILLGRRQYNS